MCSPWEISFVALFGLPLATLFWPGLYPLFGKTIVTHPGGKHLQESCKCKGCERTRVAMQMPSSPGILILMRQRARKRARECGVNARARARAHARTHRRREPLSLLAGSSSLFRLLSLRLSYFLSIFIYLRRRRTRVSLCCFVPCIYRERTRSLSRVCACAHAKLRVP